MTVSFVMFARPSVRMKNSDPTERIFMKFDNPVLLKKSVEKIKVSLKCNKNNGYFT